ncbi:hypothetical protein ACTXT7_006095 [Hymenolepis weldensis]
MSPAASPPVQFEGHCRLPVPYLVSGLPLLCYVVSSLPGQGSNQPTSSSDSDFQVVTSTNPSQPLPPPSLQSIRLVRVESPKSPSKPPMEVNVEPQERPFLFNFLLPHRRHSKGIVRKPRCKGGDDSIDIARPNSALSTRLDAPD